MTARTRGPFLTKGRPEDVELALRLLVPLAVMQFTAEVKWAPGDFFAAGLLLFGSGMADLLATRPAHTTRQKQFVGALVFVVFAVVWAELAVRLLD